MFVCVCVCVVVCVCVATHTKNATRTINEHRFQAMCACLASNPGHKHGGGLTRHASLTSWAVAVASGIANVTKYFDEVTRCKSMPESLPNIRPPRIEPGTI